MKKMLVLVLSLLGAEALAATVTMKVDNDWGQGFVAKVVIDNTNGDAPVNGWKLRWDFNRNISNMWNANFTQSGTTVTVTDSGWNGNIPVGSKVEFGFQGTPGNFTSLPTVTLVGSDGGSSSSGNTSSSGASSSSSSINSSIVACGVDPTTIPSNDDWLTTDGNQIVTSAGKKVWLTGANWFGLNASERTFHGLWSVNLENMVEQMARRGINVIRVPIGTEIIKEWKNGIFAPVSVNLSTNPKLTGKNSLEIFDRFLAVSKACGVKVILDQHHADQNNSGHIYWGWVKGDITIADFYSTWEWIAARYKNNDTLIGYDLKNEPHGSPSGSLGNNIEKLPTETWEQYCTRKPETEDKAFAKWDNSTDANNWKHAAEQAATRILAINPKALIFVEGIEAHAKYGKWVNNKTSPIPGAGDQCYDFNWWGGNLRGVADMEVTVPGKQNQIVYSPHEYGPRVYLQPWFQKPFDRNSLRADVWLPNWLYIHNNGISPLLVGEWGGFLDGGDNQKWMEALRDEIAELKLHHTFWAVNPNSGDTGGLIKDDWTTWDEAKYTLLKPALWKNSAGKFISLDHAVKLGGTANTGISLAETPGL